MFSTRSNETSPDHWRAAWYMEKTADCPLMGAGGASGTLASSFLTAGAGAF